MTTRNSPVEKKHETAVTKLLRKTLVIAIFIVLILATSFFFGLAVYYAIDLSAMNNYDKAHNIPVLDYYYNEARNGFIISLIVGCLLALATSLLDAYLYPKKGRNNDDELTY